VIVLVRRRKIGHDPNNTTWSQSTDRYGQKIMSAQGWRTGDFLGAQNAPHANHYSAANASHIRILAKSDRLGLGAQSAGAEGDNFGLDGFQDLLGRLNGKSEVQLEKDQQKRADLELKLYAGQKWGNARFVRGGYLVGDKIEQSKPAKVQKSAGLEESLVTSNVITVEKTWHVPKEQDVKSTQQKRPKSKLSYVFIPTSHDDLESQTIVVKQTSHSLYNCHDKTEGRESKQTKSTRPSSNILVRLGDIITETSRTTRAHVSEDQVRNESKAERVKRKAKRRARKEVRRLHESCDLKHSEKPKFEPPKEPAQIPAEQISPPKEASKTAYRSMNTQPTSPTVNFTSSRQAARQRYIQQKKMSSTNPQALKEVLCNKKPTIQVTDFRLRYLWGEFELPVRPTTSPLSLWY